MPALWIYYLSLLFYLLFHGSMTVCKHLLYSDYTKMVMVEVGGVEPPSENRLTGTSPSAVCYFHSLTPTGTNTLRRLVASLMHGTGKAYRAHVLHSNHTRARLVDLPGRTAAN